jgi:hypothetical protein
MMLMTKLYELSRGDKFKILSDVDRVPPAAPLLNTEETYKLSEADGLYANCFDSNGNRAYVAAYAEVEKVG